MIIVLLAWAFRPGVPLEVQKIAADIPVAVAPAREAIPINDHDGDGVPDWQESFANTQLTLASTSEYTPSNTLTEQFALTFFEQMMRNETYGDLGRSNGELVDKSTDTLLAQVQDELITTQDIKTTDQNTPQALSNYGETVATIIQTFSEKDTDNEAVILERALKSGSTEELTKIEAKITIYQQYLKNTQAITVPNMMVGEHLALLNSYQAIVNDLKAMLGAFDDPMMALLRLKRYQDDADGLYASIINMYTKLLQNGATWDNQSVVFELIEIN